MTDYGYVYTDTESRWWKRVALVLALATGIVIAVGVI